MTSDAPPPWPARRKSQGDPPPDAARKEVSARMAHWKAARDLAGVCDDDTDLAKLATDEQEAWRAVWKDVDTLLKKAGESSSSR
jgi:hypothetical protein